MVFFSRSVSGVSICAWLFCGVLGCGDTPEAVTSDSPSSTSPFPDGGIETAPEGCRSTGSGLSGVSGASSVSGISGSGACAQGGGNAGSPEGDAGSGIVEPDCHERTFTYVGAAKSVWVTGEFSSWGRTPKLGALELVETSAGHWSLTHVFAEEGVFQYKLILDGTRWIPDPSAPAATDGNNNVNSLLYVCEAPPAIAGSCDFEEFQWQDPVMYFVMTDRFFDSDGKSTPVAGVDGGDAASGPSAQYEGGDLKGVAEKVEYLADLGVTALWLSAPYENRNVAGAAVEPEKDVHLYSGYHGYWPSPANITFTKGEPSEAPQVESRIGTAADLHEVIDTAHAATTANGQGMKVLFDYVMKHVDTESALYKENPTWFYKENGKFPLCKDTFTRDGVTAQGWDHPFYTTHCAFTSYLAPFDFDKAAPRDWSVDDAMWWAKEFGIDGYRLDAIKHVPKTWLTQLRTRLKAEIAEPAGDQFYLVGETFDYNRREKLKEFVNPDTMLDGQFDFPFKLKLCETLFKKSSPFSTFATWLDGNDGFYGEGAVMSTWIGNHDVPRAIHFASGQIKECWQGSDTGNSWTSSYSQPTDAAPYERLALAYAVMMTSRGVPLIYYGDEVGLAGGGDPDDRRMMPFSESSLNAHQKALRADVKALANLRGKFPQLGRGLRKTLSASSDTWVYSVGMECDTAPVKPIVVAINRADTAKSVELPAGSYTNLITKAKQAGGKVSLGARSFLILQ